MPATYESRIDGLTTSVAVKAPVVVATSEPLTLYGEQVVDGVAVYSHNGAANYRMPDRVLVMGQPDPKDNGIYEVSLTAWTRARDFDGARDAVKGTVVYVMSGTIWGDTLFQLTTEDPVIFGQSNITFTDALGRFKAPEGLFDPVEVYLEDNDLFRAAKSVDVAPVVQSIINSYPADSRIILYYPSSSEANPIYQSDVSTNGRTVSFIGKGTRGTFIRPTDTFTRAPFRLNYRYSSLEGMTINDNNNTWLKPGFVINRNNTSQAMVLLGEGGNTGAIKLKVQDVQISNSRGQGIRYEGGPISTFDRVGITASCAGGFHGTGQGGDTNHWKMLDVTFTRNFGFGMWMESGNNGGGAGVFVDTKIYQSENWNLRIDGNANSGSIFLEMSNGWSGNGNTTRVAGSPVLQVIRDATSSLEPGMYMDNPVARGFPLGTYIIAVNKDTGEVTMNQNATSSGTTNQTAFYSNRGMRKPSIWLGPNSYGNQLHVMGDALDPECWRDDGGAGSNQIAYAYSSQQFTHDLPMKKMRIFGGERNTTDPNKGLYFTTYADFTTGSNTVQLTDLSVLNRIKYGATVTSSGAITGNTTVSSVDQTTGVVTLAANAIATGRYLIIFRPNQRGGYLWRMLDDNVASIAVTGTNVAQRLFWTSRSSLYMGSTTAGSTTLKWFTKQDEESQGFGVNTPLIPLDKSVVPEGVTVSSFTDNGDGSFTVEMSQPALLTRTGVTFLATNTVGIRQIYQNTVQQNSNSSALGAGYYLNELYRTVNGEARFVVPAEQDGRYRVTWDPPSLPAGGAIKYSQFFSLITTDADGKAVVNMALGDFVDVSASRDLAGIRAWVQITGPNQFDIYLKNETSAAIDLAGTSFYVQHTPRL